MTKQEHYVYIIFRPDGRPCYVGKGKGNRWEVHERRTHNPYLARIIAKAGGSIPKIKVREDLTDAEACETEIAFIAAIGRRDLGTGPLVNLTDGGDGAAGAIHGFERRAKRSLRAKEDWNNPEYRSMQVAKKIGNKNSKKSHILSVEWAKELSQKMMGNSRTRGMKFPLQGEMTRSRWQDDEWRAQMMTSRRQSGMYSPERVAERVAVRMARYPKKEKIARPRIVRKGEDHHWFGRSHSEAARKKLSEQRIGTSNPMYGKSGALSPRAKPVQCVDDGQMFPTVTAAVLWVRGLGYGKAVGGNIISCCKGKLKTSYGRVWRYVEPECA